jgi:hypothetical protein
MADSKRKEELESDLARKSLAEGDQILEKSKWNNAVGDGSKAAQASLGSLYGEVASANQFTNQIASKVSQDEERLRLEKLMKEHPPKESSNGNSPGLSGASETPFDIEVTPKKK